tara:strand:- start:1061 stop:1540 length:480 start_codon:yes stop_codon:yes gene_type:complete
MENSNPNLRKNGGKGTFVGNALRWLLSTGTTIAPEILNIAGTVTGVDSLNKLGNLIRGDENLSSEDKDIILRELDRDISAEKQITKRWVSDNTQSHWLPRLIRPLTLANFVILTDIVVLSSIWGQSIDEAFIPLVLTMGVTVIGGYFTVREIGKSKGTY